MPKIRHKNVKFTPEEMAYEAPAEIDFSKGLVFRGHDEWRKFLSFKRGYVKLGEDLRKRFKSDDEVRAALEQYVKIREVLSSKSRRKIA